jgi:hypothetical protein
MSWLKNLLAKGRIDSSVEVGTIKTDVSTPIAMTEEQKHALWLMERSPYPTSKEDLEEVQALVKESNRKAQEAFDNYTYPTEPMYKIVQELAGHFIIQRRMSRARIQSYEYYYEDRGPYGYMGLRCNPYYPWADKYVEPDTSPFVWYETVKNTDSPVMERVSSYGYRYSNEYRTKGYSDLAFNIFREAEEYLQRMVQAPEEREVGYNFPPLERVTMLLTGPKN